jgi:RNA polymerase sigma factor for flagellar operon FliA
VRPRRPDPPECARHWERFLSERDEAARAALILGYGYLVVKTRERVVPNVPWSVSVDDLLSEGTIALIRSVDDFDARRGVAFPSFAISRIRGAMLEWLRHEDWVPRSVRRKQKALASAAAALAAAGRALTAAWMANELDMSPDQFAAFAAGAQVRTAVSLEAILWAEDAEEADPLLRGTRVADDRPGPLALAQERETRAQWAQTLGCLRPELAHVVRRYIWDEMRLKQIAAEVGKSESRIHQRWQAAQAALRAAAP